MKFTQPPKPALFRNNGETEQVSQFVQKVGENRGSGSLWLDMTYAERLHAEWMCQGDPIKENRVKILRSVEILFRPIQDVLAEDDMRLGDE
jgi:hypothetical protein